MYVCNDIYIYIHNIYIYIYIWRRDIKYSGFLKTKQKGTEEKTSLWPDNTFVTNRVATRAVDEIKAPDCVVFLFASLWLAQKQT